MATEKSLKASGGSFVEWSAILAGAALAIAISIVLLQFGSAVGIASMDTLSTDMDLSPERVAAGGIYVLLIQVVASVLGAYLTGWLRAPVAGASSYEREIRDGMHGVLAWATGTIVTAIAAGIVSTITALADNEGGRQSLTDTEHNVAILLAFFAAATSVASAVASWFAATKGGEHRDDAIEHKQRLSFRHR
jgi:hypothetical protein